MVNLSNIPVFTRAFSTIPGWLFGISSINSIFDIFFGHFSSKDLVKHGTHENFDRSFDFGMKCIVKGYVKICSWPCFPVVHGKYMRGVKCVTWHPSGQIIATSHNLTQNGGEK